MKLLPISHCNQCPFLANLFHDQDGNEAICTNSDSIQIPRLSRDIVLGSVYTKPPFGKPIGVHIQDTKPGGKEKIEEITIPDWCPLQDYFEKLKYKVEYIDEAGNICTAEIQASTSVEAIEVARNTLNTVSIINIRKL